MTIASRIVEAARRVLARDRLSRQLGSSMPHDIGVGGNELVDFAVQSIEAAPRMSRMRAVFGLKDRGPHVERWRNDEMVHACARCAHKQQCDRTLRGRAAAPGDVAFCPNRDHYATLAARAQ